jgi:hypothetical protein
MFAEALKQDMKACDKDSGRNFGKHRPLALECTFPSAGCARRGLLVEHLLHVADFTLHLPACFFHRAAIAQV